MICTCDQSPLFPKCLKEYKECGKERFGGYSTGKWSDDDDYKVPIITFRGRLR